jgi:hypothetical protein
MALFPTDDRADQPSTALASSLAGLLGRLGVRPAGQHEAVCDVVTDVVTSAGLDADVASLRWGCLVLSAEATAAALLRYQVDVLRDALDARCPGAVSEITIRVKR